MSNAFSRLVLQKATLLDPVSRTGHPRTLDDKNALECIFKVCRTGMQWREVDASVSYTTVFRRMHRWQTRGVFEEAYAATLNTYKRICPPTRYCIDSSFVKNAYGRQGIGRNPTDRGRRATKLSVVTDQNGVAHRLHQPTFRMFHF